MKFDIKLKKHGVFNVTCGKYHRFCDSPCELAGYIETMIEGNHNFPTNNSDGMKLFWQTTVGKNQKRILDLFEKPFKPEREAVLFKKFVRLYKVEYPVRSYAKKMFFQSFSALIKRKFIKKISTGYYSTMRND